jgi:hypothetical protein
MKMQTKLAIAIAATLSSSLAFAVGTPMKITVASPTFGTGGDLDSTTGVFTEFGFTQFAATSLYEINGLGQFTGVIRDTNKASVLTPLGISAPGYSNTTISNLAPLTPPFSVLLADTEGFSTTWGLVAEYDLNGSIATDGTNFTGAPSFTSGSYNIFFDDYSNGLGADSLAIGLTLTSSNLQIANLDLLFDVTFATPGFLSIDQGSGFVDASTLVGFNPAKIKMILDTNVNPPIPNPATLLATSGNYKYRSTTLDGSISPSIPEPGSIALLGIGLFGLAASRIKKSA